MLHTAVVCPFCPLLCDDLEIADEGGRLELRAGGCREARTRLAQLEPAGEPSVRGERRSYDEALAHAAALLARARQPLISGLGCDVDGIRAALRLAETVGAIVDHGASDGLFANLLAMQRQGWVTATLAEIRNRADIVLFFGTDGGPWAEVLERRVLQPEAALVTEAPARRRLFLGPGTPPPRTELAIFWPAETLHRAAAILRARLSGRRLADGFEVAAIDRLAASLRAARYAAILWDAAALPREIAEVTVAQLAGLLLELNRTTRAVGLPLARSHHAVSANQVCSWQWGVPLRTRVAADGPEPDPLAFASDRLLARDEADLLLWISAFGDLPLPRGTRPTIALLAPTSTAVTADVVLPVAVPGIDHAGTAFRMDQVVAMPLAALRSAPLPTVADVLDSLRERIASSP